MTIPKKPKYAELDESMAIANGIFEMFQRTGVEIDNGLAALAYAFAVGLAEAITTKPHKKEKYLKLYDISKGLCDSRLEWIKQGRI